MVKVSMTSVPHDCTNISEGNGACLHFAKPFLDLRTVKLAGEGVVGKEDRFSEMEGGESEAGHREWVSGDRGLDPCHCIFLHSVQLLQNSLSHTCSGRRNLAFLQCHRGNTQGNLGLLWLNGVTVVALLQHFPKGPRLGPIAIKDLQNIHK